MNANKLIVGLTGMPGSGKSIVVEAAREIGYDIITMGDVVREETANGGLDPTPSNIGEVMLELRKKGGKGNWGQAPMPPYSPRVADADIEKLVDFVLSL